MLHFIEIRHERLDAALVDEVVLYRLVSAFIDKRDIDARVQKRLFAQTVEKNVVVKFGLLENIRVGLKRT